MIDDPFIVFRTRYPFYTIAPIMLFQFMKTQVHIGINVSFIITFQS